MPHWLEIIALTLLAGLAIPLGGLLALKEHIRSNWLETEFRHGVIAFGGGALLAAVALVLIPEGSRKLGPAGACLAFLAGSLFFLALDILLERSRTPASQLVAMVADFLPEALALGATLVGNRGSALLLAGIMALQNLPEGFNAYRELLSTKKFSRRSILTVFLGTALLGPLMGLAGLLWLSERETILSCIMLFAAGGILYIVFGDIAPQARVKNHWLPPMGAVFGFLLGLLGQMLSQRMG